MKKAWSDLKSFITVTVILLFAYCIVFRLQIPQELAAILTTVVGFFLGAKSEKNNKEE
jgi:hypothetical protein